MPAAARDGLEPGPWRHRGVAANGARFHLATGERFGPTRPLVLLLHGTGDSWWAWRHQIPALDEAGLSVAALDLRGHGASDQPPRGYDPHTTADDVAGVIRSLGFGTAVVVGQGWGGVAAWSLLGYAPATLRGLGTVAAAHPLALPRGEWAELLLAQLPGIAEWRLLRGAPAGPYAAALRDWPAARCAVGPRRSFLRSWLRGSGRDYRRRLRRPPPVPVLAVYGEDDPVVTRQLAAQSARWLANPPRLLGIPGAGSRPAEQAPDAVTGALLDWIATLPAT